MTYLTKSKQPLSMLHKGLTAMLLAGAAVMPFSADAKPAYRGIINYELPDGTTLPIRLMGDERAHRTFTEDGYLLQSDGNGGYVYATLDDRGNIVASARKAVAADKRSADDISFLSTIDREKMTQVATAVDQVSRESRKAPSRQAPMRKPNSQDIDLLTSHYPSTGSPKALVILVEYKDVKFTTTNARDYFVDMLTKPGFDTNGATGSALDYFTENSGGRFTPEFDVLGPVTLPQRMKYYGSNDWSGNDQHPEEMVIDALDILDDEVDFSQYDTDGDGYIDNVYLFYAGRGEADGGGDDTVWPHSWEVYRDGGQRHTYDGVMLNRYACSNEIDSTTRRADGIGTFVHEFSHVMGLPDIYTTIYNSAFTPGAWCVLDYGPYNNLGRTPPNYGIFERYSLGWMEPDHFSGTGTFDYSLEPITSNRGYLVQTDSNKEFFLIETRTRTGWDAYIPGEGMLVWYIDYDFDAWDRNTVNNSVNRQRVNIIEADGRLDESTRAGDCFPGTANVTSFTAETSPAFVSRTGKPVNVEFTNISFTRQADGSISYTATHDLPEWTGVKTTLTDNSGSWTLSGRSLTATSTVSVFTPAGVTVATVAEGQTLELPTAGIYIIRDGKKSSKVSVK